MPPSSGFRLSLPDPAPPRAGPTLPKMPANTNSPALPSPSSSSGPGRTSLPSRHRGVRPARSPPGRITKQTHYRARSRTNGNHLPRPPNEPSGMSLQGIKVGSGSHPAAGLLPGVARRSEERRPKGRRQDEILTPHRQPPWRTRTLRFRQFSWSITPPSTPLSRTQNASVHFSREERAI